MAPPPPPPPPPNKAKKPRKAAQLDVILKDKEGMKKMREEAAAAIWYDGDSPAVRARRTAARENYEYIARGQLGNEEATNEEIYNIDTVIETTNDYLGAVLKVAVGKLERKLSAHQLYQHKQAIYWWLIRFIPDFATIAARWHLETSSYIHFLAQRESLSVQRYEKNNLTDTELCLFFKLMTSDTADMENTKQHYAAWLMVYISAVRPGSFTVCPGYAKGDLMATNSLVQFKRPEDETLRWRDVKFVKFENGVGVRITFHYVKGHRDPYKKKMIDGKRIFTFPPTRSNRYELDLSAILLGIAFSRGLFKEKTIKALHSGYSTGNEIPQVPAVSKEAVFLSKGPKNTLNRDKPMSEYALNPKLRTYCTRIGLLGRNSMYGFRRAAIVHTRRSTDTETAKDLAGHLPGSNTLYAYDDKGLADMDVTALRLGEQGMTRLELQAMFGQIKTDRFDAAAHNQSLPELLRDESSSRLVQEPDFIQMEERLIAKLTELSALVTSEVDGQDTTATDTGEEAEASELEASTTLLKGTNTIATLQLQLYEGKHEKELEDLNQLLKDRKALRKNLRNRLRKEIKQELRQNQGRLERAARADATGATIEPDFIQETRVEQRIEVDAIAHSMAQNINALPDDDPEDDPDDGDYEPEEVDEAAIEDELDRGRGEPKQWEAFGDEEEVEIRVDHGDGAAGPLKHRINFIKDFMALSETKTSALTCSLCESDPTIPVKDRKTSYTLYKLDRHQNTEVHTPKEMLRRAFAAKIEISGAETSCDLCVSEKTYKEFIPFLKHFEKAHAELLAEPGIRVHGASDDSDDSDEEMGEEGDGGNIDVD